MKTRRNTRRLVSTPTGAQLARLIIHGFIWSPVLVTVGLIVQVLTTTTTTPPLPNDVTTTTTLFQQQQQQRSSSSSNNNNNNNSIAASAAHHDEDRKDPCFGKSGILHIGGGDKEGAAGTIFFLFIMNQLLYAERHNLLPWIHLSNFSHWIYDPLVHGQSTNQTTTTILQVYRSNWTNTPLLDLDGCPSAPPLVDQQQQRQRHPLRIAGNGVWRSYFEPLWNDDWYHHPSCRDQPVVQLTFGQLLHGLHLQCPYAVRSWRYGGLAPQAWHATQSTHEWLGVHRRQGARLVQQYYRPNNVLAQAVQRATQRSSTTTTTNHRGVPQCLAMHVRHSDKANHRRRIKLMHFRPYVETYLNATNYEGEIYLATDSSAVLPKIQQHWPPLVADKIRTQGDHVIRSPNRTAVFRMGNHHETNLQVLTDILAMAQCQFLIHGFSAVSEATIYWNLDLHQNSVNLEDPRYMRLPVFEQNVRQQYAAQARS